MPRISLPTPEELNAEQRAVYDAVVAGPRGRVVGPLRAVIHSPDLAMRWSKIGEFLRYSTSLPRKLNELAIIVTGRRWNSQLEFHIHAEAAQAAGISAEAIAAIRAGEPPVFAGEDEAEVYEFTRQMQLKGDVDDALHAAVTRRWGEKGVVELTAVIGYYTMVSMMLNAQGITLPPETAAPLPPLDGEGLSALVPARIAAAQG